MADQLDQQWSELRRIATVERDPQRLAQLTTEYQSHSGAVNTSTTPKVQYGYTLMSGGANNSRLVRPVPLSRATTRLSCSTINDGATSWLSTSKRYARPACIGILCAW